MLIGTVLAVTNCVASLPAVTVYASKNESVAEEMPAIVDIVRNEEISRSAGADIPAILSKRNIFVRSLNSNPMQAQLSMRGFGDNSFARVKVLCDGIEADNVDMFPPDLARMVPGALERIEVIHGPSPVMHGDGAVGGVVNLVVDERDREEPLTRLVLKGGSCGTAAMSFNTSGPAGEEGLYYGAGGGYARSDGWRDSSGYDIYSIDAWIRKKFSNGAGIKATMNYANALYSLPGALTYAEFKRDPSASAYDDDTCRVWNTGGAFEMKGKLGDERWIFLSARYMHQNRRSSWGNYKYANTYMLDTVAGGARYADETQLCGFENEFTAGVDLRRDFYDVDDNSGMNNPGYRFDRFRADCYMMDEFFVSSGLSFAAGARCGNVANKWSGYRGLTERDSDDPTADFELSAIWRPQEGTKVFLKGTRFHRSAFCDEMNYTHNGRMLEPETGWSLDTGVKTSFSGEFEFSVNAYAMLMKDEIFFNPYVEPGAFGWNGYNCNSPSDTRRFGADVSFGWKRKKTADLRVAVSAVRAEFGGGQYDGRDVPAVPGVIARAEGGVWVCDEFEVRAGLRFAGSQVLSGDYMNAHGELASYTVFDAGCYYSPSWAEGLTVSLTIDNLFDKEYCDYAGWSDYSKAYYYPANGRMFMAAIAYEF